MEDIIDLANDNDHQQGEILIGADDEGQWEQLEQFAQLPQLVGGQRLWEDVELAFNNAPFRDRYLELDDLYVPENELIPLYVSTIGRDNHRVLLQQHHQTHGYLYLCSLEQVGFDANIVVVDGKDTVDGVPLDQYITNEVARKLDEQDAVVVTCITLPPIRSFPVNLLRFSNLTALHLTSPIIGHIPSVRVLSWSCTLLRNFECDLSDWVGLEMLHIQGSFNRLLLPPSPSRLTSLEVTVTNPHAHWPRTPSPLFVLPEGDLSRIIHLKLDGVRLNSLAAAFPRVTHLYIDNCRRLINIVVPPLCQVMMVSGCFRLEKFTGNSPELTTLYLRRCTALTNTPAGATGGYTSLYLCEIPRLLGVPLIRRNTPQQLRSFVYISECPWLQVLCEQRLNDIAVAFAHLTMKRWAQHPPDWMNVEGKEPGGIMTNEHTPSHALVLSYLKRMLSGFDPVRQKHKFTISPFKGYSRQHIGRIIWKWYQHHKYMRQLKRKMHKGTPIVKDLFDMVCGSVGHEDSIETQHALLQDQRQAVARQRVAHNALATQIPAPSKEALMLSKKKLNVDKQSLSMAHAEFTINEAVVHKRQVDAAAAAAAASSYPTPADIIAREAAAAASEATYQKSTLAATQYIAMIEATEARSRRAAAAAAAAQVQSTSRRAAAAQVQSTSRRSATASSLGAAAAASSSAAATSTRHAYPLAAWPYSSQNGSSSAAAAAASSSSSRAVAAAASGVAVAMDIDPAAAVLPSASRKRQRR